MYQDAHVCCAFVVSYGNLKICVLPWSLACRNRQDVIRVLYSFHFFFLHATMVHVQGVRSCVGSLVIRESTESFLWANVST